MTFRAGALVLPVILGALAVALGGTKRKNLWKILAMVAIFESKRTR
jgi:hypothetical protein